MNASSPATCPFPKFFPSRLERDDTYFMKLAFNQAVSAWNEEEVPIGAVAIHAGEVIAADHNRVRQLNDPTAHAEMLVLTQASKALGDWRLNEVTLYVTKEPCPMCSGAMIVSRMGRVVYAVSDPRMGCLGGATHLGELSHVNHRPIIEKGILETPCMEILQAFFQGRRAEKTEASAPCDQPTE